MVKSVPGEIRDVCERRVWMIEWGWEEREKKILKLDRSNMG